MTAPSAGKRSALLHRLLAETETRLAADLGRQLGELHALRASVRRLEVMLDRQYVGLMLYLPDVPAESEDSRARAVLRRYEAWKEAAGNRCCAAATSRPDPPARGLDSVTRTAGRLQLHRPANAPECDAHPSKARLAVRATLAHPTRDGPRKRQHRRAAREKWPAFILLSQFPFPNSDLPSLTSKLELFPRRYPPLPPAATQPRSLRRAAARGMAESLPRSYRTPVDGAAAEVRSARPSERQRTCRGRAVTVPPEVRRRRDTRRR